VDNKLQWTSCKRLKKVQHSVKRKHDLGSDLKFSYLDKKAGTNLFSPRWKGTVRTLLITHEISALFCRYTLQAFQVV
jgi:hypothetical protein